MPGDVCRIRMGWLLVLSRIGTIVSFTSRLVRYRIHLEASANLSRQLLQVGACR